MVYAYNVDIVNVVNFKRLELNLVFFICQNKANDLWYNFIHNYIHMYVLCYNTIKDRQGDK